MTADAGLNEERLAAAISAWWAPISEHLSTAGTYTVNLDPRAAAEAIAAEYTALDPEPTAEVPG